MDQRSLRERKKRGIVSEFVLIVLKVPRENRIPEPIRDFIKMPRTVLFWLAEACGGNSDDNYIIP